MWTLVVPSQLFSWHLADLSGNGEGDLCAWQVAMGCSCALLDLLLTFAGLSHCRWMLPSPAPWLTRAPSGMQGEFNERASKLFYN